MPVLVNVFLWDTDNFTVPLPPFFRSWHCLPPKVTQKTTAAKGKCVDKVAFVCRLAPKYHNQSFKWIADVCILSQMYWGQSMGRSGLLRGRKWCRNKVLLVRPSFNVAPGTSQRNDVWTTERFFLTIKWRNTTFRPPLLPIRLLISS